MTTLTDLISIEKIKTGEVRALITGNSGCGKTVLMKKLVSICIDAKIGGLILFDYWNDYPSLFVESLVINSENIDENLALKIESTIANNQHLRIDMSNCSLSENTTILCKMLNVIYNNGRFIETSFQVFIDDLPSYVTKHDLGNEVNSKLKEALRKIMILGRSRNISLFTSAQKSKRISNHLLSEFNSFFTGRTTDPLEIKRNIDLLGLDRSYLTECKNHEFIYRDVYSKNLPVKVNFGEK